MSDVFVFGSNLAGRHGAGAALNAAINHGAIEGQGVGLQGESYAIPTKDANLNPLSLDRIRHYVYEFLTHAYRNPQNTYYLTAIGCGRAGYQPHQIAPMFRNTQDNVILPTAFREALEALQREEMI
jgi:hypothetical protein